MYTILPMNEKNKNIPIYPVTLGVNRLQKYISRPSGAIFHHILCVSEGEGLFRFDGVEMVLGAGNAVFISKSFPVDYGPKTDNFRTSWLTFQGDGGDSLLKHFCAANYAVLKSDDIEPKIAEICRLADKGAPGEFLSAKTYSLVIDFFISLQKQRELPLLEKAKRFIKLNCAKDLSVAEIAGRLGISASLLFKLFREQERTTPIEYLQEFRIQKACNMLTSEKLAISEIGSLCGFSDTSYFCKVFKKWVGCSPASYRKKMIDW